MPAKSKKQEKLMRAVANNPNFAKKVGIKQSVGKEYMKKYKDGGKVTTPEKEKERIKDMAKEERMKKILTEDMKTFGPKEESKPVKKKAGGKIGMGMTKNNYKKGGKVSSCSKRADGCAVKGKTKGRMV